MDPRESRSRFVEFRRVSSKSRWMYVGNNARLEVKGIDTCKVDFCGGHSLMLHDFLYTPEIRRNLVSFSCNNFRIALDNVFMVLDFL